jgi:hypothetical protein
VGDEVVEKAQLPYDLSTQEGVDRFNAVLNGRPSPHTLRHGMTVKNPTDKEAKEIFEAARVAGIDIGTMKAPYKSIWFSTVNSISRCLLSDHNVKQVFITRSEFIARIKGEVK